MKLILLTLVAFTVLSLQRAEAVLLAPYFGDVRTEVTNQLAIASNAPALDKKLITTLRKALTLIDKANPTNVVSDLKTLTMLTTTLNKSSLSNVFDPSLQLVVDIYGSVVGTQGESLSNRLAATYPSGPHNAAENNLDQLFAALDNANGTANSGLAAKTLSLAAKKGVVASKLVAKAEAAPAPPAQITARVTGSFNVSIKTQGAGIVAGAGLVLNGAQQAGLGVRGISFVIDNVLEGTHTTTISEGAITQLKFPGIATAFTMQGGDTGTATVTRNNVNGTAFGTFTFTATGDQGTTGTITVTGEFFGTF